MRHRQTNGDTDGDTDRDRVRASEQLISNHGRAHKETGQTRRLRRVAGSNSMLVSLPHCLVIPAVDKIKRTVNDNELPASGLLAFTTAQTAYGNGAKIIILWRANTLMPGDARGNTVIQWK